MKLVFWNENTLKKLEILHKSKLVRHMTEIKVEKVSFAQAIHFNGFFFFIAIGFSPDNFVSS